jgi:hypothetical protein
LAQSSNRESASASDFGGGAVASSVSAQHAARGAARIKIWVGVTDEDWFTHLSHPNPDEVNFWQPSGARAFRALAPG